MVAGCQKTADDHCGLLFFVSSRRRVLFLTSQCCENDGERGAARSLEWKQVWLTANHLFLLMGVSLLVFAPPPQLMIGGGVGRRERAVIYSAEERQSHEFSGLFLFCNLSFGLWPRCPLFPLNSWGSPTSPTIIVSNSDLLAVDHRNKPCFRCFGVGWW